MKKEIRNISIAMIISLCCSLPLYLLALKVNAKPEKTVLDTPWKSDKNPFCDNAEIGRIIDIPEIEEPEADPSLVLSEEEIELIALVTMAEAEGEPEEGQRLVIDVIFNRRNDPHFPQTIHDVVYQPNAFSSMWNGRVDRCYISGELCRLVEEEFYSPTDTDVIFFNAGHYSAYGVPMYSVGNHYFSKYE